MINITAIIKATSNTGSLTTLNSLFKTLITQTRLEKGCIRYDLHQVKGSTDTFIMMEEWASDEAIEKHNSSQHFQEFVSAAGPLLAAPLTIYVTDKVL